MSPRRILPLIGPAGVLLVMMLVGCQSIAPPTFSGDVDVLLSQGEAYAARLVQRPAEQLTDSEVLMLGYLERARLGLGSPFRLVEYLLRDTSISQPERERGAYAILAATVEGRGYAVDPRVLEMVRLAGAAPGVAQGAPQLQLLERSIATAPSASAGEQAVRIAYRIASAELTVLGEPGALVASAAAMIADRRRAREDAVALLRTAAATETEPLALLVGWRREMRFQVEGPALRPRGASGETTVAEDAPRIALSIRALAQRLSAPATAVDPHARSRLNDPSYLPAPVAHRLWELTLARGYPPQAPVAVAVSINRTPLLSAAEGRPWERDAMERFADGAWNEERLVSGAAILRDAAAAGSGRLALIELQAAVYLRSWGQEEPWLPGDAGPAVRDLVARFGIERVDFGGEVLDAWKPYFLRSIAVALSDLQRVLPTASVRGLRIRIESLPEGTRALAMHDPGRRTLFLPPRTGAGTLAHEVAHDLDWQLAKRRYAVRGGYATDLSIQRQRGDRIASSLGGLAAALSPPGVDSGRDPHDTRPAEVFARGTDWLTAAALARQGRPGGYLTSYQDPELPGYGSTRGPDTGADAVPSLLSILEGVAPVDQAVRVWALDSYGPARSLSPRDIVRAIAGSGAGLPLAERIHSVRQVREQVRGSLNSVTCRVTSVGGTRDLVAAQRGLAEAAADAAVRGAVIAAAQELAGESGERGARSAVDAWLRWQFYGAPEPSLGPPEVLVPVLEELMYRARADAPSGRAEEVSVFPSDSAAPLCGWNPYPAPSARAPLPFGR